ncbi:MAG: glycoside hydrolase family 31 protein [Alcaligenaceae bacterium]|nr:glycoside hydrolase family 31 protein [Alcaligenaceae bacterium]
MDFVSTSVSSADFAFEGGQLRLRIEAHAPGVFRLRCATPDLLDPEKPSIRAQQHAEMLLVRHEAAGELACSTLADGSGWQLEQGDARLELGTHGLSLGIYRGEACIARSTPEGIEPSGAGDERLWSLGLTFDEHAGVYGLGEDATDLDRRGQRRVSDAPGDRVLPLLWSPVGWGLYFNHLGRTEHDIAYTTAACYRGIMHARMLDVFVFVGEPGEILNQYTALTGRTGQPGLWPMGVWLDQTPGQPLAGTLHQIRDLREHELGLDAFSLSDPAILGFQSDKPVFEWSGRLPEWRGFMADCEALNVHVSGSCFPGVLPGTVLFDEWEDRGWLLCNEDSEAQVFPGNAATDGRAFALLDLTHKDVYRLWVERHRQAFEDGLGAPICHAQFDIPDGVVARGGESGAVLRTIYPLLVRRALFDAVAGHKTPQEGLMLSRDLFPGAQRYAWQQGPEPTNDWDGFANSLRAALSTGNSGVTVQTHRLGSVQHPASGMSAELYLRWLAMCVFSANFSFQGVSGLMPDAFGESVREQVAHWLRWRYRLLPYVSGIIEDAVRTGLPVQRSMALSFPDDLAAHAWDTQYLLGPALLVAPVMGPGDRAEIYLPAGDAWWDLNTGWRYEGGTHWSMSVGHDTLPVFGREGHMLCLGPVAQHTGEINSARILDEVWMFGMPEHSPVVMRNKIRVMQMQGSSYIKGLEGLRILPSEGLEVKRRGAEVRISRAR